LVGLGPGEVFPLVEPLVDDVDELLAQVLDVAELRRIDHGQPLGHHVVLQGVSRRGGEIVVEFPLLEAGVEQPAPEVVVDAPRVTGHEIVAQVLQGLGPGARRDGNQGAVFDGEAFYTVHLGHFE
jgi:hypothetical protein